MFYGILKKGHFGSLNFFLVQKAHLSISALQTTVFKVLGSNLVSVTYSRVPRKDVLGFSKKSFFTFLEPFWMIFRAKMINYCLVKLIIGHGKLFLPLCLKKHFPILIS